MFDDRTKGELMATSTTGVSAVSNRADIDAGARVHRRISPQAGHALEILGHAIEYLIDEYVHDGGSFSDGDPRLEAIEILMSLNRQAYFACPEVPTLRERLRAWLHHSSAARNTDTSTRLSS